MLNKTSRPEPAGSQGVQVGAGVLARLGRWCVRRRGLVLGAALVTAVLAGIVGAGASDRMGSGGLTDPDAPSARAERILADRFDAEQAPLVLIAEVPGPADAPEAIAAGATLTERVTAMPGVRSVDSYFTAPHRADLRSTDGRAGLLLVRFDGDEEDTERSASAVVEAAARHAGPLRIQATGPAALDREIDERAESDLTRAELLAAPISLLILLVVFGSVVAAGLPLLVAVAAIAVTLAVLAGLSGVTDVSVFSLNLTTALGLGLAIDYSLFLITRYREELVAGRTVTDAVAVAMDTAGRTVAYSAVTVALALSALLVFPGYFLRSFAMAGIAGSLATAAVSLLVLPALLGALGRRTDTGNLRRLLPRTRRGATDRRGWHRLAMAVMRRPVAVTVVTVAALGALAVPFTDARFGLIDHRVLPSSSPGHQAAEDLAARFAVGQVSTVEIIVQGRVTDADLATYADTLSRLEHVDSIQSGPDRRASDGTAWLTVVTRLDPTSRDASALVEAVRAVPSPAPALVAGEAATLVDTRNGITDRLPLAAAVIVITTVALLFALTGSVLVPLKAIALAALSLTATFGALVLIFQDGHLRDLLGGFTVTGWIDITAPVLMFCVAYGLAMDYEVFLISRIQEEHTRGGDNTAAVAAGLQRTGRLVTAAAVLIAVVLGALATSGITYLKMLGVGLALAVLVDAFIVRALLVPALMRLAGEANWWAPAPLRRVHARFGLRH